MLRRRVVDGAELVSASGVGPTAAQVDGFDVGGDRDRSDVRGDRQRRRDRVVRQPGERGQHLLVQRLRFEGLAAQARRAREVAGGDYVPVGVHKSGANGGGADVDGDDVGAHSASIRSSTGNSGRVQLVVNSTISPAPP